MPDMEFLSKLINPDGITDPILIRARESFWEYCRYISPKFFREDRKYLHELCDALQALYEGKLINPKTGKPYRNIMINMPPRHGKSYTLTLFCQWTMGRDNETRIISVSYNDILAGRFARTVRDGIDAESVDKEFKVFADVFPSTKIKYGDASYQLWSLEDQYFSYLATGFGGTITGMGCRIGIIDDPIKNNEEAFNDSELDNQWAWYTDTFLSRVDDNGGIQILVMTRWSTRDLCGRILSSEEKDDWYVYERPACIDAEREEMLCPTILSFEGYQRRRRIVTPAIADANYQQKPVDIKGRLYTAIKTYIPDDIPRDENGKAVFDRVISYTDTADEGSDFLFNGIAGEKDGRAYMLDVIYTDAPMEETEPMVAEHLYEYQVADAKIESNNGGRGFARNVQRILWDDYHTRSVNIEWFHQSANKKARILSGASNVMNNILMPEGWEKLWPEYYAAMSTYQRRGNNAHDDAPDGTTGLGEMLQENEEEEELQIWRI